MHTCAHSCTFLHAQVCTGVHLCMHKCAHLCKSLPTCVCTSVHRHAQVCTGVHMCSHACMQKSAQVSHLCTGVHKCAQVCTCVCRIRKVLVDFRWMSVGCSMDVRYVRRCLIAGRYVDSPWMFRRHSLDLQRIWSVAICWSSSAVR